MINWMQTNEAAQDFIETALHISMRDHRNITIWDKDGPIGLVISVAFKASADEMPPVLEVTVPEIRDDMGDGIKAAITRTVNVVQAHGGTITFRPWADLKMSINPEEQVQAEQALREQLIPSDAQA